jgi:hypothetical protein
MLILLSIYLISFLYLYRYFRIAFSKNGVWSHDVATGVEVAITILPIVNTFFTVAQIIFWIHSGDSPYSAEYLKKTKKAPTSYNKFFRIK